MPTWTQARCLRESCLRHSTFTEVCSTFQTDFQRITSAYHEAEVAVQVRCTEQSKPFLNPLSEMAKTEGGLVEFCLARFVEIRRDEDLMGHDAVKKVMVDVWRCGSPLWHTDIVFFNTIPQKALDVNLEPIVDTYWQCIFDAFLNLHGLLNALLAPILTAFHNSPLAQYCIQVFSLFIMALLAITALARLATWAIMLTESEVVQFIYSIPVLSHFLRGLSFLNSWFFPTQLSAAFQTTNPPPYLYFEHISNFTAVFMAMLPTFARFSSKAVHGPADNSLMPTGEGFQKIVNDTFHMAKIASNMTILPVLLGASLKSVVIARSIVRSSDVTNKAELLTQYNNLKTDMEKLVDYSMDFSTGVPALLQVFGTYLSIAIDSVEKIESPDVRGSLSLQMSFLCGTWWLATLQLPGYGFSPAGSYTCGGFLTVSMAVMHCAEIAPTFSGASFCSRSLAYAPGPLMIRGIQKAIYQRQVAVRDLQMFVQHLTVRMERLHQTSVSAWVACQNTKENFEMIFDLTSQTRETTGSTSREITVQQSHLGKIEKILDRAGQISTGIKLGDLQIQMEHLTETIAIHTVASDSFASAQNVIRRWIANIGSISDYLLSLETQASQDTWATAWDNYEEWHKLKRLMRDLEKHALEPLADTLSELRLKGRQDQMHIEQLSANCYTAAHEQVRRGEKVVPVSHCILDHLQFEED